MDHGRWFIIRAGRKLSYSPIKVKPVTDLERLNQFDIILASTSPRRQFLLGELGLKLELLPTTTWRNRTPNICNLRQFHFTWQNLKQGFTSLLKEKTILITADTIVWLNHEVIGKPRDAEDAKKMLNKLSGNMHYVYTGVSITSLDKETLFTAESKVFFRNLTESEISYYVKTLIRLTKQERMASRNGSAISVLNG